MGLHDRRRCSTATDVHELTSTAGAVLLLESI
jgi:hypothetical protein